MIGYRARLATIACWFLVMSIHNRNPMILSAGDTLLRLLLFWAMFLPLGARYSVDAALDKNPSVPRSLCNLACAAILLQMTFMYFFSFILKDGSTWNDGTALYYALSVDQLTRPLGTWMCQFTEFTILATRSTLLLESVGSLLPFIPISNDRFRMVAIAMFCSLHIGIAMTMDLGLFSYVAIVGWIPFLPSSFWDFISTKCGKLGQGTTIYFDGGHAGNGKKVASLLKTFLGLPHAQLTPTQTDLEVQKAVVEHKSLAVRSADGELHVGSAVTGVLCSQSPIAPISRVVRGLARFLGRPLRSLIASLKFRDIRWKNSIALDFIVGFCLLYVFAWCIRSTNFEYYSKFFPQRWNFVGRSIGVTQYWNMFAPNPTKVDGWFQIGATMEDGSEIDIYNDGKPLTRAKPEVTCRQHKNMRWRKYMTNLAKLKNKPHRYPMANFFCRQWNQQNPDRTATRITLGFTRERTLTSSQRRRRVD